LSGKLTAQIAEPVETCSLDLTMHLWEIYALAQKLLNQAKTLYSNTISMKKAFMNKFYTSP